MNSSGKISRIVNMMKEKSSKEKIVDIFAVPPEGQEGKLLSNYSCANSIIKREEWTYHSCPASNGIHRE